ncbi:MAG: alpha-1,4-glucan--maltose-1-phosphate maltosyltransferase [Vicinamibacterales bacterium]
MSNMTYLSPFPSDGRCRVIIEDVEPVVDSGRFAVKRVVGEDVPVEATIFADGSDVIAARLLVRFDGDDAWHQHEMVPIRGDRMGGRFLVSQVGTHWFTIEAWIDHFGSWRRDLARRIQAGQSVDAEWAVGARLVRLAAEQAEGAAAAELVQWADVLASDAAQAERQDVALSAALADAMKNHATRHHATRVEPALPVCVEPRLAAFSAWYELFPRSCASQPGRHGTLRDCEAWLPYIAEMGFDVLYLPPVHPIGVRARKGRNNSTQADEGDVGSPWAIGSAAGGHTAIHPQLGTLDDFDRLFASARAMGLTLAMDLAFQCSADHPWLSEHPDWFKRRPDGTIRFAENPPKKYEDIYPLDFETTEWKDLWAALRDVVGFWVQRGVRIFRVDNPHTKALPFWEWLIADVRRETPDAIFLAEAFTRPVVMRRLAKLGFSQSYTYFTWRNTKDELTAYLKELTTPPVSDYMRGNLWPNTPDILSEYLQMDGREAFAARFILAATLGASYGIYGPAFELCENAPREPGSEEYLDSEKYQLRHWDVSSPWSLRELIGRVNRIRRENAALHSDRYLRFHDIDNDRLIAFSKRTADLSNEVLVVVNLDIAHRHGGWITLDADTIPAGADPQPYQVHDLLGEGRYLWQGRRNYVELDPRAMPAQIFRLRRRVRREHDFDYYL